MEEKEEFYEAEHKRTGHRYDYWMQLNYEEELQKLKENAEQKWKRIESIKESDIKNPINPYAETKLDKEKLAKEYAEIGVKVIGLRYFNVFGKGQSKEYAGVLKLFLDYYIIFS
jgi:nucleoside-diphosphate-sugar epimerase